MTRPRHGGWMVAMALCAGCFSPERALEGGGPLGYEANLRSCSDGRDNDRDGLVDCLDPDCLALNFCGELIFEDDITRPENVLALCIDRIDNDRDGQFDCGDRGCQGIAELCCVTEFSDELCSNYLDDDANGFPDCEDFVCRNGHFVTVCESELTFPAREQGGDPCRDGIDNDGDRRIDCNDADDGADLRGTRRPTCATHSPSCVELACEDGLDSDRDGFVDCEDPDCATVPPCAPQEVCDNGVDDNGDGCTDCQDSACGDDVCAGPENTEARCMDGRSNDGDGFVDCADFDCCPRGRPCITAAVQAFCDAGGALPAACAASENTFATCTDGISNDDDPFIDCADFDCDGVRDPDGELVCGSDDPGTPEGLDPESCRDGIDQDGNGFTDCADFACSRNEDPEIRGVCGGVPGRVGGIEATYITCIDRVDQDQNGFADCNDFSCSQADLSDPETQSDFDLRTVDLDDLRGDGVDRFPPGDLDGDGVPEDFDGDGNPGSATSYVANPCDESSGGVELAIDQNPMAAELRVIINQAAVTEAVRRCSNGIDEDLDGFVDCDDWDCHWNPVLNPEASNVPPFDAIQGTLGFCQGGRWAPDGGTGIVWSPEPNPAGDAGPPARSLPERDRRSLLCR
ncbi:MAG: hypothetical protein AAGH15_03705 [Myxococcota bacterium]